jgi:hypothetical protein
MTLISAVEPPTIKIRLVRPAAHHVVPAIAFRTTTVIFGTVAAAITWSIFAPWRMIASCSTEADHEAGDVLEEHQRDVEGITDLHEPRTVGPSPRRIRRGGCGLIGQPRSPPEPPMQNFGQVMTRARASGGFRSSHLP